MDRIKVVIVEDELLIAESLKRKLEDHGFLVLGISPSGEEFLEGISHATPDLVLMDIQLSGKLNGIETAERLNENYDIPIIYLSDHVDIHTVEKAKSTYPANFVSKPFKTNDLLRALEIAFYNATKFNPSRSANKLTDRIFIRTDNKLSKVIEYKDILFLRAGRAYCDIMTEKEKFTLSTNMSKVFEQFESPDFIKVHRSYIVNINKITGIDGNMITVGNEPPIQITKPYRKAVFRKINVVK